MTKDNYKVIGVMSGTSLDGIDLVYATFLKAEGWTFKILESETIAYTPEWKERLRTLVHQSPAALSALDDAYTAYLAKVIKTFMERYEIRDADAICSHGHTALHQPDKGLTYQIGNRPSIATYVKTQVVCDFRVQDVALGGQGAPLVPIGDALLFSEYDFCLNLGGFANISLEVNGMRLAYDICPVNIVLNHYAKLLGHDYDDGGRVAASGTLNNALLDTLNQLAFYVQDPPKSLGLEWVNAKVMPLIEGFKLETKDVLRTFSEHVALQISKAIHKKADARVYITGGGVYNDFLITRIKAHTLNTIVIPDAAIVEFKEALIFGFLGVLKLRNEVNCLKSVTGASKDHSSGQLYSI